MMEFIVACSCSGVKEKSTKAYKIIKPDTELPELFVGKDKMRSVAAKFPADSNAAKHLTALAKKAGRFAYYISIDEETQNIVEIYDLLTGKRLA